MTQLYKPKFSAKINGDQLFSGIWIRWQALTWGERLACANIILIPVWWVVGIYKYMSSLLFLGVVLYEWQKHGEFRLKRPTLPVMALIAFGLYQTVKILFIYSTPGRNTFSNVLILTIGPAIWLWYIQSNNIRVRLAPIAWACTISVIQMIVFWAIIHFIVPETVFLPSNIPTLFAQLANKRVEDTGFADNNNPFYLLPYQMAGEGVRRYNIFFVYPEYFAVVVAFMATIALDIKNRFWSWSLIAGCVFLLYLSQTRMVWIAFPLIVGLHYLMKNFGQRWVPALTFAAIAIFSFATLSFAPTTSFILDQFTTSTQTISEYRADSTELRFEIYRQTIESILEDEEQIIWGHATVGPSLLPGNAVARIGTHSFILGTLLYLNGLVGTVIFLVFWISLFVWFYKTRAGRPLACFGILLLYTFVSPSLELVYGNSTSALMILLCAALRSPKPKFFPGVRHA